MDFFRGCFLKLQGDIVSRGSCWEDKTSTCHVALIKANDKKHMQVFWCFWPLIEKRSTINSPLEWQGRGVHLDVCVRVDPDLQRTFKVKTCSLHLCNVKDALFQTGWPEKSQGCSEFASIFFYFFFLFLYFFPEEDGSRVWSDMRRWTSFPHRRLPSSISPPPPLSWSFNSGCVSGLSGMNIVSVPQNQPYWIMSRALCEMPSG